MNAFQNERAFEIYVRNIIQEHIVNQHADFMLLENKKAVDILICRNEPKPAVFFLEVKYHQNSHGRLGFGSSKGVGFQPEIVDRKPDYFEKNLRWVIGHADTHEKGILFVPSSTIREFLSGGAVGQKFNNIQKRIFSSDLQRLDEAQFIEALEEWLKQP